MKLIKINFCSLLLLVVTTSFSLAENSALFQNARLEFDKGNFKISESLFTNVIQEEPTNAQAYKFLGASKIENFKYQEALNDLNRALDLDSSQTQVFCYRGNALFSLGEVQAATQDLEKCLIEYPNPATFVDLARIKGMTGQYDEVITLITNAIELLKTSPVQEILPFAYTNLASAYAGKHQYLKSLEAANKAIELDPNLADAYTTRAIAKMETNDKTGALLDMNRAIEINPKDANAYYNRAILKSQLSNNFNDIYSDLLKAKQVAAETNDLNIQNAASEALYRLKNMAK